MDPVLVGDDRRTDLTEKAINPAHVLSGEPEARALVLSRADDSVVSGLWECTAGRFAWYYGSDEVIHVVEGEAHLTDDLGRTFTLRPGDVAHFRPGTRLTWEVPVYVKKFFVDTTPPGDPLSRGVRALRRGAKRALRRHGSDQRSAASAADGAALGSGSCRGGAHPRPEVEPVGEDEPSTRGLSSGGRSN